jgi:protein dithiol:quinone oxidoreductase
MLNRFLWGRTGYFLGFIASFGLVGMALMIQTKYHLEPCPLCISQRIAMMALGVVFLLGVLLNPKNSGARYIHAALQVLTALAGSAIALRHIWIQANPDKVMSECGAGFDYMVRTFPASRAIELIFKGTGECATIDWTFFGLTIPQMSLAAVIVMALYALWLAMLKK